MHHRKKHIRLKPKKSKAHRHNQTDPVNREFEAFREVAESKKVFVLTTHVNPDGDGIGSELALSSFLRSKGKEARIINYSATPSNYQFLDSDGRVEEFDIKKHSDIIRNADVLVVLDTNHPDRLVDMKDAFEQSKAYKVCIDHHLDPADFADLYIIDDPSPATGEIVYRLLLHLDRNAVTKDIADFLYTAIMTDTGSFRYPKTHSDIHRIISHLIDAGADPVGIYDKVYEQGSAGRLRLLGMALANLQVIHRGRVAYLTITQKMLIETGTTEVDTDAFVSYTLSVAGVKIGLMFTELNDGVKINFRSKGEIWINELAKEFGGNGHMNAAGARLHNVKLADILRKVLDRSQTYVQ